VPGGILVEYWLVFGDVTDSMKSFFFLGMDRTFTNVTRNFGWPENHW